MSDLKNTEKIKLEKLFKMQCAIIYLIILY